MTDQNTPVFPQNQLEQQLLAIGAADGRYQNKLQELPHWVSEYGLIRLRVHVEIEWLIALSEAEGIPEVRALTDEEITYLRGAVENFTLADAVRIKETEKTTNHDVKAVEYFVKEVISAKQELGELKEWIHFGCTSEDINNTAYALMLKGAITEVLSQQIEELIITIL